MILMRKKVSAKKVFGSFFEGENEKTIQVGSRRFFLQKGFAENFLGLLKKKYILVGST